MEEQIGKMIQSNRDCTKTLQQQIPMLKQFVKEIVDCYFVGGKVMICGNGGSAADSQHIAGELVGQFKKKRRGLAAIALTTDTSILTAWSNDYDFSTIFARQVEALANPDDILLGISTSGNSENMLKTFEKGKEIGMTNLSLAGRNGGKLKQISDYNINIYSNNNPRIQESHMLIYHIICELVEKELFNNSQL
jgi:D-sedoheptulose 7-phosphate isomerase